MQIFKRKNNQDEHHDEEYINEEHHDENQDNKKGLKKININFNKISFFILIGMIFLIPVIFIPVISIPFQLTKTIIIFFGVLFALLFALLSNMKEGEITLPFNNILYALWVLPVVYFISSLLSVNPRLSFLGQSLEIDTFAFITLMVVLTTLVVMIIKTKNQIFTSYMVLFISFIILSIFQGLRLILGPDFLSFNILTLSTSNILGKWNDLPIFFGLLTIMSLITLSSLQLNTIYRRVLYAIFFVSLFFLAVVNFFVVWVVVGLFSLGFFVHNISANKYKWRDASDNGEGGESFFGKKLLFLSLKNTKPFAPLFALFVSVIFIFGGTFIGERVSDLFNISQIEARPSWQSTIDISKAVYEDNELFGAGPNMFVKKWIENRPVELNNTIFWDTDFIAGVGIVPTAFVSVGLIGGIVWLVFLSLYLFSGIRTLIINTIENKLSYFISLSSFLGGLYLWILIIFYTPSSVLITLAFFFTGVYVTSLRYHKVQKLKEKTFEFSSNPRTGFISIFLLTFFIILTILSVYITGRLYASSFYLQKGIVSLNIDGDINKAEFLVGKSTKLNGGDRQQRLLADIYIRKLVSLQSETDISDEELRNNFAIYLAKAIEAGQGAAESDPTNYRNWVTWGSVYHSVVPVGIDGAYENAKSSYEKGLEVNPNSPSVYLILARLEVANGDTDKSREYITKALNLKNDYTEAILLLSQIEINDGNIDGAIQSIESAVLLTQNDPAVFFQLGLLKYEKGDNGGAITAFETADDLVGDYSNAKYFLGLAYGRVGRTKDAILEFEEVLELNPNNAEVMSILENLRSGKEPFEEAISPSIEEIDELPINEAVDAEISEFTEE